MQFAVVIFTKQKNAFNFFNCTDILNKIYFFKRSKIILNKVLEAKLKEIEAGVDGFMVYDSRIVPYVNEVRSVIFTD